MVVVYEAEVTRHERKGIMLQSVRAYSPLDGMHGLAVVSLERWRSLSDGDHKELLKELGDALGSLCCPAKSALDRKMAEAVLLGWQWAVGKDDWRERLGLSGAKVA